MSTAGGSVLYAEVKRSGQHQPVRHYPASSRPHPGGAAAAGVASNKDVSGCRDGDDDDDETGPELPPKLDVSQLTVDDRHQPVNQQCHHLIMIAAEHAGMTVRPVIAVD